MSDNRRRVFVIGLDGGTWDIIRPLIDMGRLPNFEHMIKNGCSGVLKSTMPPMTPPAWASIVTGKNPGKHGVFDFYLHHQGNLKIINSKSIRAKRVWDILSKFGLKVLVVNVPIFYPPDKVNGIFISGMLTPSKDSNFVYPSHLKRYLLDVEYEIETDPEEWVSIVRSYLFMGKKGFETIIKKYNEVERKRAFITYHFIDKIDPDFVFIVFEGTDRIQHYLWSEDGIPYIYKHYEELDKIIGEFLNRYDDASTTFFIISDHGFYKINKVFLINSFLYNIGLLKTNTNIMNILKYNLFKIFKFKLFKRIFGYVCKFLPKDLTTCTSILEDIDFSKTIAYCVTYTSMGIYVSECDNKERIIDNICNKLNSLIDPETGKRFVKAYKKEEIYKGDFTQIAPDIILQLEKGYTLSTSVIKPSKKLRNNNFLLDLAEAPTFKNGDHTPDGIFIAYGACIRKGISLNATVMDIAPTIMYLFGLPIPNDIDGRVLKEIFTCEIPQRSSLDTEKERISKKIKLLKMRGKI